MEKKDIERITTAFGKSQDEDRFYVYMLCEEKDGALIPFYIGKGEGDRMWRHEKNTEKLTEEEKEEIGKKNKKIQEIEKKGKTVHRIIVKWGLTEDEAFMA